MNNMRIVTLKIWRRDGQLYAAMAMNAEGGALSWNNVDCVEIDRVTIEADNWRGQFVYAEQKEPRRKK